MLVVNFKQMVPMFGTPNLGEKGIKTKGPDEIFKEQKKSEGRIMFDLRCSCTDSGCTNEITFSYNGLNHYTSSKNLGSDTEVNIHPYHKEQEGRANNVMWNPTEENVTQFVSFSETVREAIAFKKELLRGLFALLQVRIKGYDEIEIVVRKEETEIRFILFEIPNDFPNVPMLYQSENYRECLGVIATLPVDTDTSKITNDYADMKNPFFEPITQWVKLLGEENELNLEIRNIWVMPE